MVGWVGRVNEFELKTCSSGEGGRDERDIPADLKGT
jgi:hypothetical protein